MEKLEMLYEGKAKKVFKTDNPERYIIEYKDDATAFNGQKKGSISKKGVINNNMSALLFKVLEEKGIPTHFEELLSEREMLVKEVDILPIEVIVRNIVAGSLAKRIGVKEGTELDTTIIEFCYKDDDLNDPMINEYHIEALKLASQQDLEEIKKYALEINNILKKYFLDKKIKLVDFKLEFGKHNGKVILADEISPDTCRLWDADTNEKLDKDRFRRDLGNVEGAYKEVLKRLNL